METEKDIFKGRSSGRHVIQDSMGGIDDSVNALSVVDGSSHNLHTNMRGFASSESS